MDNNNNQRPKDYVPQFAKNQNTSDTPRRSGPPARRSPRSASGNSGSERPASRYNRRPSAAADRSQYTSFETEGILFEDVVGKKAGTQGMQFEDVVSSESVTPAAETAPAQPGSPAQPERPAQAERPAQTERPARPARPARNAKAPEMRKAGENKPKRAPKSYEEPLPPVPVGGKIGDDPDKNKFENFFWYNHLQRTRNIFAFLTVFCVLIVAAVGFVSAKLDLISTDDENTKTVSDLDEYAQTEEIYEDETFEEAPAITNATSYTDFSYKWATDGAKLRSSKNVINVLLIGLDSDDALENGGRSDSMILASLNKKEKKIYLTSFYRDTWTYMNTGGVETYSKMNAAYMYGQDAGIVSTIENNFKINIDYYVAVDFSSFTDIINILGGITVKVEQYEAEYINKTTVHTIDYGDAVKLDGWEALVFARIRHSDGDSDVSRTRRQRIVISAFIDSVKDANLTQINEILNKLFSYVRTDLSKMEILSYAVQALANGWADYDIESVLLNDESIYRTGYVGNSSVVFVDFPAVSELVQTTIYGDSSVVAANSQNPFDFMYTRSDGEWALS